MILITRWLFYQNFTFSENIDKRFVALLIVALKNRFFGDKDIISCFEYVCLGDKVCAEQALCSVAIYGISDFFACYKTDFSVVRLLVEEYEPWRMPSFVCFSIDHIEVSSASDAIKRFDTADGLYRQSLSAFGSSGIDHFSAIFGFHSGSKTVCSFSWCVVGLKCSFHDESCLIICKPSVNNWAYFG